MALNGCVRLAQGLSLHCVSIFEVLLFIRYDERGSKRDELCNFTLVSESCLKIRFRRKRKKENSRHSLSRYFRASLIERKISLSIQVAFFHSLFDGNNFSKHSSFFLFALKFFRPLVRFGEFFKHSCILSGDICLREKSWSRLSREATEKCKAAKPYVLHESASSDIKVSSLFSVPLQFVLVGAHFSHLIFHFLLDSWLSKQFRSREYFKWSSPCEKPQTFKTFKLGARKLAVACFFSISLCQYCTVELCREIHEKF